MWRAPRRIPPATSQTAPMPSMSAPPIRSGIRTRPRPSACSRSGPPRSASRARPSSSPRPRGPRTTSPSLIHPASNLRVTDTPGATYTGSGVHTGAGCTRSGDYSANCHASGITLIKVSSGDQNDKVVIPAPIKSSLDGDAANDSLQGSPKDDTLTGGPGADALKGMNGNDQLLARDNTDDTTINCDGGTHAATADKAVLDSPPNDSPATGCEKQTRPSPYVALGDSLSNGYISQSQTSSTGFVATPLRRLSSAPPRRPAPRRGGGWRLEHVAAKQRAARGRPRRHQRRLGHEGRDDRDRRLRGFLGRTMPRALGSAGRLPGPGEPGLHPRQAQNGARRRSGP